MGNLVFVRLQPYKKSTLMKRGRKVEAQILWTLYDHQRIGEVACELELPPNNKIHNVFHVSCLKKIVGQEVVVSLVLPPLDDEGKLILVSKEVLEIREKKLRNKVIVELLVKWKGLPIEDVTWEGIEILNHPNLHCLRTKNL